MIITLTHSVVITKYIVIIPFIKRIRLHITISLSLYIFCLIDIFRLRSHRLGSIYLIIETVMRSIVTMLFSMSDLTKTMVCCISELHDFIRNILILAQESGFLCINCTRLTNDILNLKPNKFSKNVTCNIISLALPPKNRKSDTT